MSLGGNHGAMRKRGGRTWCRHALLGGLMAALAMTQPTFASQPDRSVQGRADGVSAGQRVSRIGFRLALANLSECGSRAMQLGATFHDLASYPADARPIIAQHYGLGWGFGVLDVVPQGGAARSGLRRGDEIVALDGIGVTELGRDDVGNRAIADRVTRFSQLVSAALARGPARVGILRDGMSLEFAIVGDPGCEGDFVETDDRNVDAWSDGVNIAVSSGLVTLVGSDDALAFVLAHEMAHNLRHHVERLRGHSKLFAELGIGNAAFQRTELEADRLALRLVCRAGFDPWAAKSALEAAARWGVGGTTHPTLSKRLTAIDDALKSLDCRITRPGPRNQ
jgi:hypothetical protein